MTMTHLLEADHISKYYGNIVALKDISMYVDAGEVTVFKSLGLAIEDVVSAGLAYRSALKTGRGTQIPL